MKLKLIEKNKSDVICFDKWLDAVDFFFKRMIEKKIIDEKTPVQELSKTFTTEIENNIHVKDCGNGKELYFIDLSYL